MSLRSVAALVVMGFGLFALLLYFLVSGNDVALLNPQGAIARQQTQLMIAAVLIMLVIIAPVTILIFVFAIRYREGNKKTKYNPDEGHSKVLEILWWVVPTAIILVLAVLTWKNTHALDPYKPIESDTKSMTIQVVALQWKWLFLYPEQEIATVNYVQFPEDTPVTFEITADNAPMSSFWIPSLGGQIYAMTGMSTKLNLIADEPGEYDGKNAEINGRGFAKMTFTAQASTREEFDEWLRQVRNEGVALSDDEYAKLIQPSESEPVHWYSLADKGLYNKIMTKYMVPMNDPGISPNVHE